MRPAYLRRHPAVAYLCIVRRMRVALTIGFVLGLSALLVFAPQALDAFRDRQHRVVVDRPLKVYQTAEPPWFDDSNSQIATTAQGDTLPVMRIRYGKDYMVVRVKLAGGQQGYVFSGDGLHLDPPDKR